MLIQIFPMLRYVGILGLFGSKQKEEKKEKIVTKDTPEKESIETKAMEDIIEEKEGHETEENISTELAEEERLQEIEISITEEFENLLKETEIALKQNNIPEAKRIYHNLREKYMELPEEEKKQYKNNLWEIYKKLK